MSETTRTDAAAITIAHYKSMPWSNAVPIDVVTVQFARELERDLAAARAEVERLEALVHVPGVWACAKCKLEIVASVMSAATGGMRADSKPQPCPNGCGPMWKVTERDRRIEATRLFDAQFDQLSAARAKVEALRDAKRWQPIETAPTDGTRILLCGRDGKIADGHYGKPLEGWANPRQFVWPYIYANPTHWMPLPTRPAHIDAALARTQEQSDD